MSVILDIIANSLDKKYTVRSSGEAYRIVRLGRTKSTTVVHLWECDDAICLNRRSHQISKSDPLLLEKVKETVQKELG